MNEYDETMFLFGAIYVNWKHPKMDPPDDDAIAQWANEIGRNL